MEKPPARLWVKAEALAEMAYVGVELPAETPIELVMVDKDGLRRTRRYSLGSGEVELVERSF